MLINFFFISWQAAIDDDPVLLFLLLYQREREQTSMDEDMLRHVVISETVEV